MAFTVARLTGHVSMVTCDAGSFWLGGGMSARARWGFFPSKRLANVYETESGASVTHLYTFALPVHFLKLHFLFGIGYFFIDDA